ncbi:MAG: glycine--tRNA ligase subunit beta [Proteobacteria bacterium]|nr:glycine--tRNA ligase subunit beta [Pseudomonadota bacterium]
MADLLLELFSEEIPARMQAGAARDLERLVVGALTDRGLLFEAAKAFYGPRRLTLVINGLPIRQPDVSEELKGPKVDAPAAAIEGFLKKSGLTREQLTVQETPKGKVYLAVIKRDGRPTADVLSEVLPECMAKLPWPKSMRWPQKSNQPVRWVRPLHSILCTLDGEIVPFTFAGIGSSNRTRGHRFLSSGFITASRFEDYARKLREAHVVLDAEERKAIIFEGVKSAAFVHGLEMIPDEGLLDEVAGLNEWPVVLIGAIEDQFMDVPAEILQTSMRTHQKYFSLRDPKTGKFANRFAVVANMVAEDGGKTIVAGNERVLRARLSDAKFFWDQDRKTKLEDRVAALGGIVFHAKLGTQLERVERIEALAGEIAEKIGADMKKAKRAARLAKADLTTGVVGEFPELQGVMGRYYALNDGEDAEVADAVRDHYKPQGPNDRVPSDKVAIAVALADKFDIISTFFAVDERPTGSGDPFALRRAALGIIRILLDNRISLLLQPLIAFGRRSLRRSSATAALKYRDEAVPYVLEEGDTSFKKFEILWLNKWGPIGDRLPTHEEILEAVLFAIPDTEPVIFVSVRNVSEDGFAPIYEVPGRLVADETQRSSVLVLSKDDTIAFFADRLKVALREKGTRHDLIDAVFSLGNEDDLVRLVARVEALQVFLKSDDGANLLVGYKRAANILKIEEKKDDQRFDEPVSLLLCTEPAEEALANALYNALPIINDAIDKENFAAAMREMSALRAPVDAFFDKVKVNADDKAVRANRLNLLGSLRATLHQVADFSKIEG